MVVHRTEILYLVNSNPGTHQLRQRQNVIHFMLLAQSTRSSTPLLRRLVGFEKFRLNFHLFLVGREYR